MGIWDGQVLALFSIQWQVYSLFPADLPDILRHKTNAVPLVPLHAVGYWFQLLDDFERCLRIHRMDILFQTPV